MAKYSKKDQAEARAWFRRHCRPGSTIHCVLRHVSRSGMMRHIGLVVMTKEGALHPNYAAAALLGYPLARDAIKVGGCGMDMGFAVVSAISQTVYPKGRNIRCDRCEGTGTGKKHIDNDREAECPSCTGTGKKHIDGGYVLKHAWL